MNSTQTIVYSRVIKGLGCIQLRPLDMDTDITVIHDWVNKPYAKYWGMQDTSLAYVKEQYQEIEDNPYHDTFIGVLNDTPIFLMERYKASQDLIAQYYDAQDGDYGMHILVGPPDNYIPKFTWHVFTTIMFFLFDNKTTQRVVVEPDINNQKIHLLNTKAGFVYQKEIKLPHKTAHLAFCTSENFAKAFDKAQTI
ncbi:GNAT family N-acetyltransferase [Aquimarina rhabdastrellae]